MKSEFCSVKPSLKKVAKYENKFAKLQKSAADFAFRQNLKAVKKKEFTIEEEQVSHSSVFLFSLQCKLKYIIAKDS